MKVSRSFLRKFKVSDKDKLIGIVAGLSKVKNHPMLIKAMKLVKEKISNAKLLVIGDGPEKEGWRRMLSF